MDRDEGMQFARYIRKRRETQGITMKQFCGGCWTTGMKIDEK